MQGTETVNKTFFEPMDSGTSRSIAGRERKSTVRTVAIVVTTNCLPFYDGKGSDAINLLSCSWPLHHHLLEMVPYWERSVGFCHKQDGHSAVAVAKSALVRGGPSMSLSPCTAIILGAVATLYITN